MGRYAVIFPGIGYHADKPLLYYSGKLAASMGYEVIRISYPACEVNLKQATSGQIHEFVRECLSVTEKTLDELATAENEFLFISKSIGTAVAAAYAAKGEYTVRHVFFTPLAETFDYVKDGSGIAFNGTKDNWADCDTVCSLCRDHNIPVTTIDNANHSLETGVVSKDTETLCQVLKSVEEFVGN
ncbi:MAG: hypothetical protein K6E63_10275 [Lachnospiraceae bacterium]|nr:hypothetical protein [Lachnospiraceae bacterium]